MEGKREPFFQELPKIEKTLEFILDTNETEKILKFNDLPAIKDDVPYNVHVRIDCRGRLNTFVVESNAKVSISVNRGALHHLCMNKDEEKFPYVNRDVRVMEYSEPFLLLNNLVKQTVITVRKEAIGSQVAPIDSYRVEGVLYLT